jgi:hypothetical protein
MVLVKKLIALLLLACTLVITNVGCGGDTKKSSGSGSAK